MPRNVPPELEDKFRSCKEQLLAKGNSEDSAYAICYTSVVEGKSMKDAFQLWLDNKLETPEMKIGAMISSANMKKVQAVHDFMHELGAKCEGEMKEEENYTEPSKTFSIPVDHKELNLSYVKSIIGSIPEKSMAVKYVAKDTIRHPVFIWGNKNRTDIEGEFFTRETDFWDGVLGKSVRPLTWDHAQDEEFKADPLIGETIEWEDDDIARWAVSKLKTNHKYRKAIDALIEKKNLGSAAIAFPIVGASSDSAPQYVERVKVGKSTWLARWPWFATALTVTPCEPLMIAEGMDTAFVKSLGVTLPDVNESRLRYEHKKRQVELLKLKGR